MQKKTIKFKFIENFNKINTLTNTFRVIGERLTKQIKMVWWKVMLTLSLELPG